MWSEYVDSTNFEQIIWPSGSSGANVLWGGDDYSGYLKMKSRLQNFRCWMLGKGFKPKPIGPGGYCKNGNDQIFNNIDASTGQNTEILRSSELLAYAFIFIILFHVFKCLRKFKRCLNKF